MDADYRQAGWAPYLASNVSQGLAATPGRSEGGMVTNKKEVKGRTSRHASLTLFTD
ncbi:unnamed protein product [marine sediment metagenome]|uniref:Uncharacterized protein n=1 Tax=marine sediment metagenome TaxID=412755 RepID=X1HBF9_9ZZZZ